MHYHIDTDTPRQERWGSAKEHYRDVMRYPDDINFITILRDPRDRLLSFYAFFVEFETGVRGGTVALQEPFVPCVARQQFLLGTLPASRAQYFLEKLVVPLAYTRYALGRQQGRGLLPVS